MHIFIGDRYSHKSLLILSGVGLDCKIYLTVKCNIQSHSQGNNSDVKISGTVYQFKICRLPQCTVQQLFTPLKGFIDTFCRVRHSVTHWDTVKHNQFKKKAKAVFLQTDFDLDCQVPENNSEYFIYIVNKQHYFIELISIASISNFFFQFFRKL